MSTDRNPEQGPFNPATGKVSVLDRLCDTCIFRPGNLMQLNEGAVESMVAGALAKNSVIICHDTLPYGKHRHAQQAVCRGFYNRHKNDVYPLRLARMMGVVVFIAPPGHQQAPAGPAAAGRGRVAKPARRAARRAQPGDCRRDGVNQTARRLRGGRGEPV